MDNHKKCSFCGREYDEKFKGTIVKGPDNIYICEKCVERCSEMIEEEAARKRAAMPAPKIKTPSEIKKYLDEYVVGQEQAKKILSVAVYNHMKMLEYYDKNSDPDIEIEKNNVIMVGPSGTGKTYMIKTIAKLFDVPYAICDATGLTASGYVGADVETVLQKLLINANGDIKKAERGIIFIDEIDKKANPAAESNSITRDVSGLDVQQALLKLIEGTVANVPMAGTRRINPEANNTSMDTSKILFIVGGAFPGIEKIVKKRLKYKNVASIGISLDDKEDKLSKDVKYNEVIDKITHEDFKRFGLIPEFLGRLPIICPLHDLTEEEMCKILVEPKNALIKQFQALLQTDGVNVRFDEKAVKAVAKKAINDKTGARGLRAILSKVLLNSMYNIPDLVKENEKCNLEFFEENILDYTKLPQIIKENKEVRKAV